MRHATQNAAFTGEPELRQVFARSSAGEIEYLGDGDAQAFKDRRAAGESFACLVPDCESPTLTVVDRKHRRDGFSHLSGGGHPGVGVAHLQAQLLLQRWVRARYPSLQVELEMTTEDRSRRADVMVISPATGARIAFEVQYSGMTPEEWLTRHLSYRAQGIVDIWLWGYGGDHVRPTRSDPNWISGSGTLRAVSTHDSTILFIDPAWESIGYASHEPQPFAVPGVRALSPGGSGRLHAEPLDAFRLSPQRQLVSDKLEELLRAPEVIRVALEKKEIERARARAEEEARALERARATERFFERVAQKSTARAKEWEASPDRVRILELFQHVPDVLRHQPVSGRTPIALPVPPEVWQARFYLQHVHGRPKRARLGIRAMSSALQQMDSDVRYPEEAVRSWLGALEACGVVTRVPSTYRHDRWPKFVIGNPLAVGGVA